MATKKHNQKTWDSINNNTIKLAKQFLKRHINKKDYIVCSDRITNRRAREFLLNNNFLYSPIKGLYIIKTQESINKIVVEQTYFKIIEKVSEKAIVSWALALKYHIWKLEKVSEIEIYNNTKNSTIKFYWERSYTIYFKKSSIYRETCICKIWNAEIPMESPMSFLINNFQKEKNSKDIVILLSHTNFMLGDIIRFVNNWASITSLSAIALWYKKTDNIRNFELIKTAIAKCWKDFRYWVDKYNNKLGTFWIPIDSKIKNKKLWEIKNINFHEFIAFLDKQCHEYLQKCNDLNLKFQSLELLTQNFRKNIVNDSYHSLLIEGNNVNREEITLLNQENPDTKKDIKTSSDFIIKWYLDAYKITTEHIKSCFWLQTQITKIFICKLNASLLSKSKMEWNIYDQYRKENIEIIWTSHIPPRFEDVESYMNQYMGYINEMPVNNLCDVIKQAIIAHSIFVYIHPFKDGNWRTARFIMNYLLWVNKFNWVTISSRDRDDYFKCLQEVSENENIIPFTEFIINQINENNMIL